MIDAEGAVSELLAILRRNRGGEAVGVYAVCSVHSIVLEAAMAQARADGVPLLVESTANQVNQYGGYTGYRPADLPAYVAKIAGRAGLRHRSDRARRRPPGTDLLDRRVGRCRHGQGVRASSRATWMRGSASCTSIRAWLARTTPCHFPRRWLPNVRLASVRSQNAQAGGRAGSSRPVYVVGLGSPASGRCDRCGRGSRSDHGGVCPANCRCTQAGLQGSRSRRRLVPRDRGWSCSRAWSSITRRFAATRRNGPTA